MRRAAASGAAKYVRIHQQRGAPGGGGGEENEDEQRTVQGQRRRTHARISTLPAKNASRVWRAGPARASCFGLRHVPSPWRREPDRPALPRTTRPRSARTRPEIARRSPPRDQDARSASERRVHHHRCARRCSPPASPPLARRAARRTHARGAAFSRRGRPCTPQRRRAHERGWQPSTPRVAREPRVTAGRCHLSARVRRDGVGSHARAPLRAPACRALRELLKRFVATLRWCAGMQKLRCRNWALPGNVSETRRRSLDMSAECTRMRVAGPGIRCGWRLA